MRSFLTKIAVLLVLLVGSVWVLSLFAHQLVDTESVVAQVAQEVERVTGEKFIHGDVSLSFLSGGKMVFEGVAVKNVSQASTNYFVKAERLELHLDVWGLIFGEHVRPRHVHLVAPSMELERFRDGGNNWSFLVNATDAKSATGDMTFTVEEGEVIFTHHIKDYTEAVRGISGQLELEDGELSIALRARIKDRDVGIGGACQFSQFEHFGAFDGNCAIALTHDTLSLEVKGRMIAQAGEVQNKFTINLDSSDARIWVDALWGRGGEPFSEYYTQPLPLKAKVEVYAAPKKMVANIHHIESGNSSGKGTIRSEYPDDADLIGRPLESEWWFEHLDYDQLAAGLLGSAGQKNDLFANKEGFDTGMVGDIRMQAKKVTFHNLVAQKAAATIQLSGSEVVVTDARAILPEKGSVVSLGQLRVTTGGLEYDGLVEAFGDSLHAVLPVIGIAYEDMPEGILTRYRMRFNLIVRARSLTISELRLVVGDRIQIAGGVNSYDEQTPRLEATLAIKNMKFDPFWEHWLKQKSMLTPPEQQKGYNPYTFDWLKGLGRQLSLELELADYELWGLKGKPSSLDIFVRDDEMQVNNVNIMLGGSRIKGKMKLLHELTRERPFLNANLSISKVRLGDLFLPTMWASGEQKAEGSVWSQKAINFFPLHYFDGVAELQVRHIEHDRFEAFNFRGLGKLENFALSFKEAKMNLWGGDMKADITVDSEVVPGLVIQFHLLNAQVRDILKSFVKFRNISGLVSMSGKVNFSGINFDSWIDNINGSMALDGRNLFVQYYNLPAIIRAISAVRSVSGLSNAIRLSFDSGSTRMGNVNGTAYFSQGALHTTRMTFRSNESVGSVEGKLNFRQWSMDLAVKFGLISLAQQNYPIFTVLFDGPLEMPRRRLNTKSIEAWLAQRLR